MTEKEANAENTPEIKGNKVNEGQEYLAGEK